MTKVWCRNGEMTWTIVAHGVTATRLRILLGLSLRDANGRKTYIRRSTVQVLKDTNYP